jgi:rhomboid protease GluP
LLVNLAVYAVMVVMSQRVIHFDSATLIAYGANLANVANVAGLPAEVSSWRWVTAAFIHVNLLHIAMNMWVLAQIGVLSERAIGRGLFAAAYLVTGALGNVASSLFADWRGQPMISAGASGAIMGLIGIAAAFAWRTKQREITRSLLTSVAFVLVIGIGFNLDNAAHVGGLVSGAGIGLLRARWRQPMPRWAEIVLMVTATVLTLIAFAVVQSFEGTR